MKSVRLEDPYDQTFHMDNTHEETHIIGTKEQNIEDSEVEQE